MHSHGHSHGHAHASRHRKSILLWSLLATTLFVLVELVAGFQAHSLALLSDAGHNFTDALALGLAWAGVYLQSKPADEIEDLRLSPRRRAVGVRQRADPGGALASGFCTKRCCGCARRSR